MTGIVGGRGKNNKNRDCMVYTTHDHITAAGDVEAFFRHLTADRKVCFHPDDDFADYISIDGRTPSFTNDEASLYNRLMDECFTVCKAAGVDIYEVGLKQLKATIV